MKNLVFPFKSFFLFFFFIASFAVLINGCGPAANSVTSSPKPLTGRFFTLSDVHFNPYYDTLLVEKLVQADVTKWDSIFKTSSIQNYGVYGQDSNFPLMTNAFAAMRKTDSVPDFIVITGDFLGHKFQADFERYANSNDTALMNSFITKTIQFIAMELEKQFPGVPVYPVLGNNDEFCGDYLIQPNNAFLTVFKNTWAPSLDSAGIKNTYAQTFASGGYYAASLPNAPGHVIIGMNSMFFSPKDTGGCGSYDTTYGHVEMQWITNVLDSCAKNNLKVWFTCHIPPGADAYSTLKHLDDSTACEEHVKMMWKPEYNEQFIALQNQYKNTITGNLGGHTHMDEFRIVPDSSGNPLSFFHINPSISPIDSNNAGFELFTYDTASMVMKDYQKYVFNGVSAVSAVTNWTMEYDFGNTYNVNQLTGATMGTVWQNLQSNPVSRANYMLYFGDGQPLIQPQNWQSYWCCIGQMHQAAFASCACTQGQK
jgi:hypothetical protein